MLFRSQWFDARDAVNDAVREAQSKHGIGRRITASIDKDFEIAGARSELRIALDNLLANACRHTPAQTSILVRLSAQSNGSLRLAVIDDGPGIAAEHLPRLAERFYRVDQGRSRESGGTGLGLTIVREVAQRLGGGLEIASVPGEGSSFSLLLPAARIRERAQAVAA